MVIALNFIHKLRDRKGLLRSWEIPLGVASFAALMATRRYTTVQSNKEFSDRGNSLET